VKAKPGVEPTPGRGLPPSNAMIASFLIVCDQYDLNPFLKEIYPFIDQNGNLRCIVGVDGWIKTALRHPQYNGHEFVDHLDPEKNLIAVTAKVFRLDRTNSISMTEYMQECKRDTEPWNKWPYRMLHHKAFIQACRYALGMNEITDDDELDRIKSVEGTHEVSETPTPKRLTNVQPDKQPTQIAAPTPPPNQNIANVDATPSNRVEKQEEATREPGADEDLDTPITKAQINDLQKIGYSRSIALGDMKKMLKKSLGVDSFADLTAGQYASAAMCLKEDPKP
jgi:phage recombination protein Bet